MEARHDTIHRELAELETTIRLRDYRG